MAAARILLCALACLLASLSAIRAAEPPPPSYGTLALALGPAMFARAVQLNGSLTSATLPADPNLSAFRKALIDARDVLDIFAFAYPTPQHRVKKAKHAAVDPWQRARDDLNTGYTAIGDYQDLSHVNCPGAALAAMRNACVEWRDAFLSNAERYGYAALFASADPIRLYSRSRAALSDKYWAMCADRPSAALSGIANLALLLDCMLVELAAQLPSVQALTEMYVAAQVDILHNYKKQVRALRTLTDWYPSLWNATTGEQQAYVNMTLGNVTAVYKGFDRVHTLAVAPLFYAKHGPALQYRATALTVQSAWRDLSSLLNNNCWREQLELARALVVQQPPAHT